MYKVYVLYSKEFNKIYIGFTSDLEDRFLSHNEKATKGFTVKYRPWEIAFFEEFETKPNAMKREKELKTSRGRTFIWEQIQIKGLIRQ